MNRKKSAEQSKGENTPMAALLNQASAPGGFSSLGSMMNKFPEPIKDTRENSESSEYASRQTDQILEPELHLRRMGYCNDDQVSWDKLELPRKRNLYLELYRRVTNKINADCIVCIDNDEFECHLLVLQCYSKLFDACAAVKKVELPSDQCSASAFSFIYDWMSGGEPSYINLTRANVLDIFTSAEYLGINDLVEQCWAFIDNAEIFNEDSAFALYLDAKERNLPEVQELMLPRIKKFFLMLVSSSDWLELDVTDVKILLQSNYVAVNCEMEIFMAAVRWLKNNYEDREQYKYEVLKCVRFGNIAPWQLVDIKKNPENPYFIELCQDARICKMIDEGISFVIIKYWYGQENNDKDLGSCYGMLGLEEPLARNWMGPDKSYNTFREFLIYLDQYRRSQLIDKTKPLLAQKDKKLSEEGKPVSVIKKSVPAFSSIEDFLSPNRKSGSSKKLNKF
ncbi:unnamed protein product [Ceutorhynchus assimilis]|uniref:BACK domain-containing protein n=1 Tax=Ceutorhynchus assimilis TaxID=467358 RepID=A0A9N9MD45_9CUCU|nr:unnamed protein product [Ceutorhynchus assimilis]